MCVSERDKRGMMNSNSGKRKMEKMFLKNLSGRVKKFFLYFSVNEALFK